MYTDSMLDDNIFRWLARLQVEENLEKVVLPTVKEGIADFVGDNDVGYDEAIPKNYKRCLIMANGDKLIDRLQESRIINDTKKPSFSNDFGSYQAVKSYVFGHKGDGAHVLNKNRQQIGKVKVVNNNLPEDLDYLIELLPEHFNSYDGSVQNDEIGTKTRLAPVLPHAYSNIDERTETYQIKGTIHTKLGMGIVTHFTKDYFEMFYLLHDKNSDGPYINEEHQIIGVHEKYKIVGNKLKLVSKQQVDRQQLYDPARVELMELSSRPMVANYDI